MRITNEILLCFIHCHFKAYRKTKHEKGIVTSYQVLYDQLKQNQKTKFKKTLCGNVKQVDTKVSINGTITKEGIALNLNFKNDNIDLIMDGIEFRGKKNIIPIFITPFEKVTKIDKLFVALQASFIQTEFDLYSDSCKVVFGKTFRETKFKLSSLTKIINKTIGELNKTLSNPFAPIFFKTKHCQVCEFQNSCLEKLMERDDLSLLAGLAPKEILQRNNRGIFSVKQLSYTFRPRKNPYRRKKFLPELKALAIRENKTYIQEIPVLPVSQNEVFLDIEGLPDRNFYYLIGVVIRTNGVEKSHSFWANDETEQENIFIEFISLLQPVNEFTIYHYGSYETQALKTISKILPEKQQGLIKEILSNSINLLNVFTHNVYPPTYSNGLKEIARFLKYDWTEKEASGLQSTVWRYEWEMSTNSKIKSKLISYNLEDCRALITVIEWIYSLGETDDEKQYASSIKSGNVFKWGNTNYIVKEYEEINSKAYFDYQREHVFLRTEKKVYRAIKKERKSSRLYNKPDKIIDLSPIKCPRCRTKSLSSVYTAKKLNIDIVFMKQGIKKKAILYSGGLSVCKKCKRKVRSDNLKIIPTYGSNLMLWSVIQKIQYKQSSEQIVDFLKDYLKIEVSVTQMTKFKEYVSQKYITTYNEIITEITKSDIIHIDETMARIKGIDGYVWIFATYDSVYYQFRETRETEFLKETLKNFKGTLISDFYTGYDSLACKQQKCHVHLIRDLNGDFLKHQLDMELKEIVIEFGNLLRSIIATIDKYGLKKTYLAKHEKDVERFYSETISKDFESEIALSYKKRFIKYREKLFLFIVEDNVPWNNNNAEHAIKPFAKWRKRNTFNLTISNIQNHLVLLSILQTSKYRGINFFDFLKSGEKSILSYSIKQK